MLEVCPDHREWCLWLPQDQDRSMILIVHTLIAGSPGGQCHRTEPSCSVLGGDIDRDDDLAGTSLRSPDIEGVVSADRWGQMIAPTELHERTSLAIIGGKDAGNPLLIQWQAVIHLSNQRDLFLPAKAIRLQPCAATLYIQGGWQHRHHRRS